MHVIFLSEVPVTNPFQVPQQRPYGYFFLHTSQIHHKSSLNKESFPLSKALLKQPPSMLPKIGAPIETYANFHSLRISFGAPVEKPSLYVPPTELPRREMPHPSQSYKGAGTQPYNIQNSTNSPAVSGQCMLNSINRFMLATIQFLYDTKAWLGVLHQPRFELSLRVM
jgi:hypothetical protein